MGLEHFTDSGNHKTPAFPVCCKGKLDQWSIDKSGCTELMEFTVFKLVDEFGSADPPQPLKAIIPGALTSAQFVVSDHPEQERTKNFTRILRDSPFRCEKEKLGVHEEYDRVFFMASCM